MHGLLRYARRNTLDATRDNACPGGNGLRGPFAESAVTPGEPTDERFLQLVKISDLTDSALLEKIAHDGSEIFSVRPNDGRLSAETRLDHVLAAVGAERLSDKYGVGDSVKTHQLSGGVRQKNRPLRLARGITHNPGRTAERRISRFHDILFDRIGLLEMTRSDHERNAVEFIENLQQGLILAGPGGSSEKNPVFSGISL